MFNFRLFIMRYITRSFSALHAEACSMPLASTHTRFAGPFAAPNLAVWPEPCTENGEAGLKIPPVPLVEVGRAGSVYERSRNVQQNRRLAKMWCPINECHKGEISSYSRSPGWKKREGTNNRQKRGIPDQNGENEQSFKARMDRLVSKVLRACIPVTATC
jgi:hypothetical protein